MKNKKTKWYKHFLKDVNLSVTEEIHKLHSNVKFAVISQKETKDYILREVVFIKGPYILCSAKSKIQKNKMTLMWNKNKPHVPFGTLFNKLKNLERIPISQKSNQRKYHIRGDLCAEITEIFHNLKIIDIAAFAGRVEGPLADIKKAKLFLKKSADLYLFPESYPFSQEDIDHRIMKRGSIYGKYCNGPLSYFKAEKPVQIHKTTQFAEEKKKIKKTNKPTIITFNGIKIALLICYDLFNPKISSYLNSKQIDLILVSSMIPKKDLQKWKKFVYIRGQENQCPVILTSNEDKRKICSQSIIFYNPITESVRESNKSQIFNLEIGKQSLTYSPKVHWSWLLKNDVYGPFKEDFL